MAQELDPNEPSQPEVLWVAIPAPIAPFWEEQIFNDSLDMPLDYPYSSAEWDKIFEAFIDMLKHENRWIRQAAIARLKTALKSENLQVSNCEDYQPKPIPERMIAIFEEVTSLSSIIPNIFEDFCEQFQPLAKEEPYRNLIIEWLNELTTNEERQVPSDEAILAARISLDPSLNSLLRLTRDEFEIVVAQIDGYLRGLSTLCGGTNYVPIYEAMVCPPLTDRIAVDVQAKLLAKAFENEYFLLIYNVHGICVLRFKEGSQCSDWQLVDDWETALGNSIDKWIFKRLLRASSSIQFNDYVSFSRNNTIATLVRLIREAMKPDEPEVWNFQIALGCSYVWGFCNESYAFKAGDKQFIIIFGYAD